jgi:hypothetical protein
MLTQAEAKPKSNKKSLMCLVLKIILILMKKLKDQAGLGGAI